MAENHKRHKKSEPMQEITDPVVEEPQEKKRKRKTKKESEEKLPEAENDNVEAEKQAEDNIENIKNDVEEDQVAEDPLFSNTNVSSFNFNPRIVSALAKLKITKLTNIQANSIPYIIRGSDVLMRADTGSGKTLAYLLPIMQRLATEFPRETNPITRDMGCLAIIIAPTRELCQQIDTVLQEIRSQMPFIISGTLLGGEKVPSEKKRLRKGINVLVATPGRLLYHLKESVNFRFPQLKFLVLDEADRLLDMGFLNKVTEIIQALPPRQTILVSATLHKQLAQLSALSLKNPIHVGEMKNEEFSIPATLLQRYVIVPAKWRLAALAILLRKCSTEIQSMKAIVFINCCKSVDFHASFFGFFKYMTPSERRQRKRLPRPPPKIEEEVGEATIRDTHASTDNDEIGGFCPFLNCPIFRIHGNVDQIDRAKTISKFTASSSAVMFCTDVAARGLDIPDVTTIIQYDPPIDTEDYVHRVGRTARIGHDGISYLFLQDFEEPFIELLQKRDVKIQGYDYDKLIHKAVQAMGGDDDDLCMAALRQETKSTLSDNELEASAAQAWASSIAAYHSHRKETRFIFSKHKLHLGHMAAAFGLDKAPAEIKSMLQDERDLAERIKKQNTPAERTKMLPAFEDRTSEFL